MTSGAQTPRGRGPQDPKTVGLPVRAFLYTLDQVAYLLQVTEDHVRKSGMIYYEGRSEGARSLDRLTARNISPNSTPEWRVAEQELIRWMKRKGFKVYERAWATS